MGRSLLALFVLCTLITASVASPTPYTPHLTPSVLKTRHPAPPTFEKRGLAPRSAPIQLNIALAQRNQKTLERKVLEMSTPGHADYGKHLSRDALKELTKPSKNTIEAVEMWLTSHGVSPGDWSVTSSDWLQVTVPISVAEKMLSAEYSVYEDTTTGHQLLRTDAYSLPQGLMDHIDVVHPTNYFGNMHKQASTVKDVKMGMQKVDESLSTEAVPGCSSTITPNCLRNLYKTNGYTAKSSKNKFGVAGYLQEYASQSDLNLYIKRYRTDISSANFTITVLNNGPYDQNNEGDEASLDIQTAVGVAYPTPVTYYSVPGSPPYIPDLATPSNTNEPYINFTSYQLALADSDIPQTISTSYADDEQTIPKDYALRVCSAFMSMAARGQTLLFSSGDDGVGSSRDCKSNVDGSAKFLPLFPPTCPYVTAVGGTHNTAPEISVVWSGAGFSNYFSRPSFQDSTVAKYLTSIGTLNSGLYNASGRAYPDIAAQALSFATYIGGSLGSVSGTSAACPAAAAVISQLNDALLAAGKSPLGWLNPWLYANPSGLTDITSGPSSGCGTNGFPVQAGWDAATGLGTPNFVAMKALLGA